MAKTTNIDADALALIQYGEGREKEVQALKQQLEERQAEIDDLRRGKEELHSCCDRIVQSTREEAAANYEKILSKEYEVTKFIPWGYRGEVATYRFAPMTDVYKKQEKTISELEKAVTDLETKGIDNESEIVKRKMEICRVTNKMLTYRTILIFTYGIPILLALIWVLMWWLK